VRQDAWLLFSESNGRYLVEIRPEDVAAFERVMTGIPCARIGQVGDGANLSVTGCSGKALFTLPVTAIAQAFRGHLERQRQETGR
jgi:phosphoribosylformylglycinamidine synthase